MLKARLGATHSYDIDYQETFALVAKLNITQVLLSLAANLNWPFYQWVVKNAFLNGELTKEWNKDIPSVFEQANMNKVCKLKNSLCSLKQCPRAWFVRFNKVVKNVDIQCLTDHALFVEHFQT